MHARHLFAPRQAASLDGSALDPGARSASLDGVVSATGRVWRSRLDPAGERSALLLAQRYGLADPLARTLAARGVTAETCEAYLEPRLRDLMPDPSTLADMDAAVERLATACRRRERVAIFGDYDVDGAAAAALLADFLEAAGATPAIHIPDRIAEGYGPNVAAVNALAADGATLLVTVDCGTAGGDAFAAAAARGLDVVVLDHHQPGANLPAVLALVNPNRADDLSGLAALCAAGVVFMALVATARTLRRLNHWTGGEPPLFEALDLVALATVADVVPLTGLNRAFVRQGLGVMARRERPGLRALLEAGGVKAAPEPFHLGYVLGPRINAGGRIGEAALGARLLRTRDPVDAARLAARLDGLNDERRAAEQAMVEHALSDADRLLTEAPDRPALVLGSDEWHPGLVGLIAARLKERFGRPAFAIAWREDGRGVGSGRSVPGVDLGAIVRAAVEGGVVEKGGGHAMAAGVTLARARFAEFDRHVARASAESGFDPAARPGLEFDAVLGAAGCTVELARDLRRAGPFGAGQPEPVVALPFHRVADLRAVGTSHLCATFVGPGEARLRAMAFRAVGSTLGEALEAARAGGAVHAAGTLSVDSWNGRERAELRLLDIAVADAR